MSEFKPSKYQQDLFDWITSGQGSCIVEAVAGSGKTTSMVQALKLIDARKSILFLAFNKSIAEELKTRAPKHVSCMTMNALGHRAVMKQFGRITLDAKKTNFVLEAMIADEVMTDAEADLFWGVLCKLVSVAKSTGLVPSTLPDLQRIVEDTPENWENLVSYFDIEFPKQDGESTVATGTRARAFELARIALERSIKNTQTIDFNDQLFFPVIYGLTLPKHDWVFVDEAQDISAIQRALLTKALNPKGGRLVAVGDPKQAIYAFRGADSNSLTNIAKTFNCVSLPLSISYRCPKAVVREAQTIVPYIEPSETAPEGLVAHLGLVQPNMFRVKDMVVCRSTAPLVRLAYMLISAKIPAKVMGRDIGEGLANLIKKLKPTSLAQLETKLEVWRARECEKLLKKDAEANLDPIEDRYTCVKCFIECSGAVDVPGLLRAIETLFGEQSGGVVLLSTIHKAKGLEAERVFILDAWRMPLPYAKLPHQIEQEFNLLYVAITRAQKELFYVEFPKKEKQG